MRAFVPAVASFLTAVLALGCAGNPQPGEPGYPYNVDGTYDAHFDVEGEAYVGEVELTTEPGGVVSGEFYTETPQTVVGTYSGQVVGERISIGGPYSVGMDCEGMIDAAGDVDEGGDRITGEFTTTGQCGELAGTFVFER